MLKNKSLSLEDAVALVPDGTRLAIGGFAVYQKPMAFVRALARARRRDLTIVGAANSYDVDLLAAAGCLKTVETSYVGLEKYGLARNFRRHVEHGTLRVVDYPEMGSWDRFRASQEGLAFWPVGFLGGNDVLSHNPDIRPFVCPITGRPMQALPAANPQVVVIHAVAADEQGNVVLPARRLLPQNGDVLMARSCDTVIVTAEKIVSKSFIRRHARLVEIPSYRTKAVVEVPWGAHPTPLLSRYLADEEHMAEYAQAAESATTFDAYLQRYVFEPISHDDYLQRVGAARIARLSDIDSLL